MRVKIETAYLTSPEWVLNLPLTSSKTPGMPFTLQNGMRTAACCSFASTSCWFDDEAKAIALLIFFKELSVKGDVRDKAEETVAFVVIVLNILRRQLIDIGL